MLALLYCADAGLLSALQDVLLQWGGALQAVFTVFQLQVTDVPSSGACLSSSDCWLTS